ncbi:MAG: hypothetical protein H6581_29255 [Bacteroidia bacterium]|nr:hypothetical protein [Bacteroidia bacterium]
MLNIILLLTRLRDGGQQYTETNLENLIAEPFNAVSALLFLGIVAWWAFRLRGKYRKHLFLTLSLPVLLIGGVGGTIYHAFRISQVFLVMDWLPILILCLAGSIYFFIRGGGGWIGGIGAFVGLFGLRWLASQFVPANYMISTGYGIMALLILIPIIMVMVKTRFFEAKWVAFALISFLIAIFFRTVDHLAWIPIGTHFLWHIFGAAACHFVLEYVFSLESIPSVPEEGG